MKIKTLFILLVVFFIMLHATALAAIPVRVVGVSDGDTIRVVGTDGKQTTVRLHGIDAPERGQAFGTVATKGLRSLLAGRQVSIEQTDTDRYGRTVALVYADGSNVNQTLIVNGWAWLYTKYCTQGFCAQWRQDESAARAAKKGLWRDPTPTPPWEWRAKERNTQQALHESAPTPHPPSSPAQEVGSVFSGNVKSRVFHRSSCKDFRCKNCTKTFHSRQAALDAGYRPCGNCKP